MEEIFLKDISLNIFCILVISFKKIAEIEDSNDDHVESDKICQKILSIQRLKNNVKIFYLFIFIITYNKVAEISKEILFEELF